MAHCPISTPVLHLRTGSNRGSCVGRNGKTPGNPGVFQVNFYPPAVTRPHPAPSARPHQAVGFAASGLGRALAAPLLGMIRAVIFLPSIIGGRSTLPTSAS